MLNGKIHRLSRLAMLARDVPPTARTKAQFDTVYVDVDALTYDHVQALVQYPLQIGELAIRADTSPAKLKSLPESLRVTIHTIRVDPPVGEYALSDIRVLFPSAKKIRVTTPVTDFAALLGVSESHTPTELVIDLTPDTRNIDLDSLDDIVQVTVMAPDTLLDLPYKLSVKHLPHLVQFQDHSLAIASSMEFVDLPLLSGVLEATAHTCVRIIDVPRIETVIADSEMHIAINQCASLQNASVTLDGGPVSEDVSLVLNSLPKLHTLGIHGASRIRYFQIADVPELARCAMDDHVPHVEAVLLEAVPTVTITASDKHSIPTNGSPV